MAARDGRHRHARLRASSASSTPTACATSRTSGSSRTTAPAPERREAFAARFGSRPLRLDRRRLRRPGRRPRRRLAAEPPPPRGGPVGRRARQGRRLHEAARSERGRGRGDARARRATAGVFHAYLENVVFSAEMVRMREMVEAGRDRPADHVPCPRGPQRPARRALLGCRARRRRRAARHGVARRRGGPLHVRQGRRGPRTSFAWGATLVHGDRTTGEDNAVMIVRFEDGRAATMDVSWSSKGGLEGRFEAYGDGGRIIQDMTSTPLRAFIERPAGYLGEKTDADTGWVFPVPERDLRPRARRDDGRHGRGVPRRVASRARRSATATSSTPILDAAYRSMRSGQWEPVLRPRRCAARRDDDRRAAAPALDDRGDRAPGAARGDPGGRDRGGEPVVRRRDRRGRPGPPVRDRATRGSRSRRCSRATARTPASTRSSSCR